jgi:hypothetical protein
LLEFGFEVRREPVDPGLVAEFGGMNGGRDHLRYGQLFWHANLQGQRRATSRGV